MNGAMLDCGSTRRAVPLSKALTCALPALLVASLCLLPLLNKPFLIDDPEYLGMAKQIVKHPLHPMDFRICWNMAPCTKLYNVTPGNTLMGYALVPTVLLGSTEWMAHLTQVVFVWAAVIAMSAFLLRSGYSSGDATSGALFLVAIPPFLPMASTAMPDILATALGVLSFERLAAWKAFGKWDQGAGAGVALGLAGIARPHLSLLLPLAVFYLFESVNPKDMLAQIREKSVMWLPVLIGVCVLLGVILATRETTLSLDPPAAARGFHKIPKNLLAYLGYLCFPLPLAAYWIAARWRTYPHRFVIAVLTLATAGMLLKPLWYGFAIVSGVMLAELLLQALRKRDHMEMFLALWLLVPLPIVYYFHLPLKYLLPCMPAVIITCFRLGSCLSNRTFRGAKVLTIWTGVIFSILILRSDAELAEFGRTALESLIRPHVAAGEKVWYGGEFSVYWYARFAGAELLVPGEREPKPGDLLAIGRWEGGDTALDMFPKRTLLQSISHRYSFGRTMGAGIGLYTNVLGFWPWGFGSSELDRYEIWRID
uniref:Glycosyltransferase RgtA/B/C/D-like domain-containing protein n=1 Tax=Solibacter usitatus (strain Ellin6076) TaxID=234267 RepID=Q026B8_SOLUE